MPETNNSAWEKVTQQLTDPWDWAAAALGAGAGVVTTIFVHGLDGGTSAAGGATLAISARKALVASRQRPRLKKRARALVDLVARRSMRVDPTLYAPIPDDNRLQDDLEREIDLWERGAISNDEFSKQLDICVERLRQS